MLKHYAKWKIVPEWFSLWSVIKLVALVLVSAEFLMYKCLRAWLICFGTVVKKQLRKMSRLHLTHIKAVIQCRGVMKLVQRAILVFLFR